MKKLITLLLLSSLVYSSNISYGQRGDFGTCRSTVNWNINKFKYAYESYSRWILTYDDDLKGYKNGTVRYDRYNHMNGIKEVIKNRNRYPYVYNKHQWVSHVSKIFIRDCGAFNKKDRDIALKTGELGEWKWQVINEMLTNPYFVKNWKTIQASFEGYDFRAPTGYNVP